ncbi:hypothetical protein GALL_243120 [mine drainage metagenome]|uniref:Magnesium transporter MgtE intracellular domain-containing protein n=1 Tax=mine drainage metagenome TaxID=410659 RepID=A0A1J5RD61_9ZZZZ
MGVGKSPPSNQRSGAVPPRASNPYAAAAAYAAASGEAAAPRPAVADDDDSPPPGFGLGRPGPRPGASSAPRKAGAGKGGKGGKNRKRPRRGLAFPNIRLLPVTIVVAGLMLTVRINDIWLGLGHHPLFGIALNASEAQQPPPPPPGGRRQGLRLPGDAGPTSLTPAPAAAPAAITAPSVPDAAQTAPAAPAALAQTASAPAAPPAPPAVPSSAGAGGEPPTFTQNELDVLQKLSQRREALDARERDLDLRENLVKAAEERINKKIAEMKQMQDSVKDLLKQVDTQDEARMRSLAKMYESMKPKDAGKIFDQLDVQTLKGVIPYMKETKAGLIIANMSPDKAKDLTDAIAERRAAKVEGLPPLN